MKIPNIIESFAKIIAITLVVSLNASGLFAIGGTVAFYYDAEHASENLWQAGLVDFEFIPPTYETLIGPEVAGGVPNAPGEKTFFTVAMPADGSAPMEYGGFASGTPSVLCDTLYLEAKLNGVMKYAGAFSSFTAPTTTEFGSWEFEFDLPPAASSTIAHGDTCSLETFWNAIQAGSTIPNTFSDDEPLSFTLTARMVVLNEIFPRPKTGVAAPKDREYIELFNNGNTPVDVLGWKVSEMSGASEVVYPIVASGAVSGEAQPYAGASTVIPPQGFLVVEFGGSISRLNDTGDTVRLYDASDVLLDGHAYPAVSAGKAVTRFIDGVGFWVDPEPTPGGPNNVTIKDLRDAGFTEEMIADAVRMAAEMGIVVEAGEPTESGESVLDTEAPVITLNGNNPAVVELGAAYSDLGAMVSDNVNQNLGYSVEGEVDTSVVGEYIITYTAVDQTGNTGTAERIVIVYDPANGLPDLSAYQTEELAQETPAPETGGGSPVIEEDEQTAREEDVVGGGEITEEVVLTEEEVPTGEEEQPAVVTEEETSAEEVPTDDAVVEEAPLTIDEESEVPVEEVAETTSEEIIPFREEDDSAAGAVVEEEQVIAEEEGEEVPALPAEALEETVVETPTEEVTL